MVLLTTLEDNDSIFPIGQIQCMKLNIVKQLSRFAEATTKYKLKVGRAHQKMHQCRPTE